MTEITIYHYKSAATNCSLDLTTENALTSFVKKECRVYWARMSLPWGVSRGTGCHFYWSRSSKEAESIEDRRETEKKGEIRRQGGKGEGRNILKIAHLIVVVSIYKIWSEGWQAGSSSKSWCCHLESEFVKTDRRCGNSGRTSTLQSWGRPASFLGKLSLCSYDF